MERNNNEQVKAIWKPLCLLFAALLALSWVFFGFMYSKVGADFSSLENPEQIQEDNGSPVTDENDEELESDVAIPMPKAMTFRSAAALDGANAAYDSVRLLAVITPANADNKAVDWWIEFVNPASAWASGKTVENYVTVTPESDGSTTATVNCLKAFGERIKITVTSRENRNATASCTVDFAQRILHFSGRIVHSGSTVANFITGATYSYVTPSSSVGGFDTSVCPVVDWSSATYSDYTVKDSFIPKFSFRMAPTFWTALNTACGFPMPNATITFENGVLTSDSDIPLGYDRCFLLSGAVRASDTSKLTIMMNRAVSILKSQNNYPFMVMDVEAVGQYSTYSYSVQFIANKSGLSTLVESVDLSPSDVVV